MRLKQIFTLTAILFILILGVVIKEMRKPAEIATEDYSTLNLSFDPQRVSHVQISHAGKTAAKLIRQDDQWRIPELWNARADKAKITRFLRDIQQARGELRASDRFLFRDFGMEDDQAFTIELMDELGNSLLKIGVGNKKINGHDVFVRNGGSEKIYLVSADLLEPMGIRETAEGQQLSPEAWAALSLLGLDTTRILKLEAQRLKDGKKTVSLSLERQADSGAEGRKIWKFLRPNAAPGIIQEKVDAFLFTINNTEAARVLGPKAYSFDKPVWQLTLDLEGGQQVLLKAVPKDEKEKKPSAYILQVSTEPVLYEIAPYFFESLDVEDGQFAAEQPPQAPETQKANEIASSPTAPRNDDKATGTAGVIVSEAKQS